MNTNGVGAKIAWTLQSKRAFRDLKEIFKDQIDLVDFDEGEVQRKALQDAYSAARAKNLLTVQSFQEERFLMGAVRLALEQGSPDEKFDLLLQESERKGVYRSTRAAVITNAGRLLAYDGNSVLVATLNGKQGLLLDLEETPSGAIVWELESW